MVDISSQVMSHDQPAPRQLTCRQVRIALMAEMATSAFQSHQKFDELIEEIKETTPCKVSTMMVNWCNTHKLKVSYSIDRVLNGSL